MTDLDAAIRERLAINPDGHYFHYDSEMIQSAVLAVLDLHPYGQEHNCVEDITASLWYEGKPCPTLLAIAKGLGIEP